MGQKFEEQRLVFRVLRIPLTQDLSSRQGHRSQQPAEEEIQGQKQRWNRICKIVFSKNS
jgi:hypothetical protein